MENRRSVPPQLPPRMQAAKKPATPQRQVSFGSIDTKQGHRVLIYGPGGIGKTTLACMAPGPVAVFDLESSLGVLINQLPEERRKQVNTVGMCPDWQYLRDTLNMTGWDEIKTIVIDSATMAEEWALRWVLKNVPHEKGNRIERLEDYGYGKGYTHVYETFLTLLGDLDQHVRAGRHVVLIAHDCTAEVPNPIGENYIRYEPRLQSPGSGKNSVRLRAREWADHVIFIGYDVEAKDGKAKGHGSRTIYPVELPHCMAKSRLLDAAMPYERHSTTFWDQLTKTER